MSTMTITVDQADAEQFDGPTFPIWRRGVGGERDWFQQPVESDFEGIDKLVISEAVVALIDECHSGEHGPNEPDRLAYLERLIAMSQIGVVSSMFELVSAGRTK